MKNIINFLLSLSLIMTSTSAFANLPDAGSVTIKHPDTELWQSLKGLQRFRHAQDIRSAGTLWMWMGFGAGALTYLGLLKHLKTPIKSDYRMSREAYAALSKTRYINMHIWLGVAFGIGVLSYFIPDLAARFAQKAGHPNGYAKSSASVTELDALEIEEIAEVVHFLRKPLTEQYNKAAQSPEMRNYLVNLNQWLDSNMVVVAPPVRPLNVSN